MAMLDRFRAEGRRALVFSQSQATLNVVEACIREANIKFVRIDGKVNVDERDRRVTQFRSNADIPVMLLTARVGGLGLTLTEATRVVIYDPAWNPTTDNQSVDRAYRIGQTKDVVVYRLVTVRNGGGKDLPSSSLQGRRVQVGDGRREREAILWRGRRDSAVRNARKRHARERYDETIERVARGGSQVDG